MNSPVPSNTLSRCPRNRQQAIHSDLIRLSFLEYVTGLRDKGETRLFPKWWQDAQNAYAKAAAKAKAKGEPMTLDEFYPRFIPKRFNATYRRNVGITDPRKQFYSFRHTFKTGLALAGVTRDVRDALAGHSDNSAVSVYVHGISIEGLKQAIDKLHFDGLEAELNLRNANSGMA